jgi:iron uptake system component EfeO
LLLGGTTAALLAVGVGSLVWAEGDGSGPAQAGRAATGAGEGYRGLPHTAIQVSPGSCGSGWSRPAAGLQVFDLTNTGSVPEDAYLKVAATGAVLGEVEGLAPGRTRPVLVRLGPGGYAFQCLPQDTDAMKGPTVTVPGGAGTSGPAVVPVTQQDLIPPTLAYQSWVSGQLPSLVSAVDALRATLDRGDPAAARTAWLTAHLDYERLGAAYGTFGDLDQSINGTTRGLPGGTSDPGFTGFHRLEWGLWRGEPADSLRPAAAQLAGDVRKLQSSWASAQMDPKDLGLRAHEIVENTIQFELTGRSDYGSGSSLATAQANLQGTAEALTLLRPLLRTRLAGLPQVDAAMATATAELGSLGGVPLPGLPAARRERLNAVFGELVTEVAPVAAVCDVRRTS